MNIWVVSLGQIFCLSRLEEGGGVGLGILYISWVLGWSFNRLRSWDDGKSERGLEVILCNSTGNRKRDMKQDFILIFLGVECAENRSLCMKDEEER